MYLDTRFKLCTLKRWGHPGLCTNKIALVNLECGVRDSSWLKTQRNLVKNLCSKGKLFLCNLVCTNIMDFFHKTAGIASTRKSFAYEGMSRRGRVHKHPGIVHYLTWVLPDFGLPWAWSTRRKTGLNWLKKYWYEVVCMGKISQICSYHVIMFQREDLSHLQVLCFLTSLTLVYYVHVLTDWHSSWFIRP